jgi:hypothetical protein
LLKCLFSGQKRSFKAPKGPVFRYNPQLINLLARSDPVSPVSVSAKKWIAGEGGECILSVHCGQTGEMNGGRRASGVDFFSIRRQRIVEGHFTNRFPPIFNLLPVLIRAGFHPAVPAGHPGIGSPAVKFGASSTENAFQIWHGWLSRKSGSVL